MIEFASSNKELKYEQVTINNIEIAYDIQKNEWKDSPDKDNFIRKSSNLKEDNVSFIVYYKNIPIGITGVYSENIDKNSIWLDWFCIIPEFRNKGFGKQVLIDTINYARSLNKYSYFRAETTYWEGRPAISLYDNVMHLKEKYTAEDTGKNKVTLIYTYCFTEKKDYWNNKYLGLNDYYGNLKNIQINKH